MADLNEPQTFFVKYNLYKKATERIGGWIAETAASIGFDVQEKNQKQSQPKPRKRGGKKNKKTSSAGNATTIYKLRVSDFVPMATAIAEAGSEAGSEIMVPIADGDRKSDLRHEYFIKILEDTFAKLRPFLSIGVPQAAHNGAQDTPASGLASQNRFASLTVEEAAALIDEEALPEEDLAGAPTAELQQDQEDNEEDFWLALSLLLQEHEDMRKTVLETWNKYKDGKVDLIVAAMATDTAIKLAQKAEAQFELLVTRPTSYPANEYPVWSLPAVLIAKPSNIIGATAITQVEAHFDVWPIYAGLKFYLHKHMTKKTVPQVVAKDLRDPNVHERTLRAIELAQMMRLITELPERPKLWDMVSQGLLDMFKTHQIPMWLTFGVQLHFDSQDVLGDDTKRAHFESEVYLNGMLGSSQEVTDNSEDPFLPENIQDECYVQMRMAYNDMSPWVNYDGLKEQWVALAKSPKIGGHPILKLLRNGDFYFYRQHPLLCGMMKYHWFLHWHAAGISHEATSVSLFMMAHIYVGTRLLHPSDPVWPDMEFVLFNQDPRYVLFKMPDTPQEARDVFDLATAQRTVKMIGTYSLDRLNLDRDDLGLPRYDPSMKSRLFRDASVFGDTVYLPRGASGCWVTKIPGGAFNGKIDTIVRVLLQAQDPGATRGRLARAMQASDTNSPREPLSSRDGLTSVAILQHFAFWLQADMADLCFDWTQMQRQCSRAWQVIYKALELDPLWDKRLSALGQTPQRAAEAIISTAGHYPRFMERARQALRSYLEHEKHHEMPCSEAWVMSMVKYHAKTARLFRDDGPLSVDTLYKGW
ncbi:hypothetical protein P171DRAFT_400010, partial [Karstenula rhodostoma CBS 690.94]